MKLSQRGEYALRALLVLGMNHGPEVVRIRDIAQQQNIPRRFLEQILNDLKSAGFVQSRRGVAGGYRLQRAPDEISLADIIRHLEGPLAPVGIRAARMYPFQKALLEKLIYTYAATMPLELTKERLQKIQETGFDKIRFGWAGGIELGEPHYYRIQGPTFLIEYDNVQNNANHAHTVWRDFNGDFGRDILKEHYLNHGH